jgi:Asp/Glu/hydantoin racemase
MRLLVVNPNTSAAVSEKLRLAVAAAAGPDATLRVATAAFGASYISDEPSFAIAAHAALDAVARDHAANGDVDAILCGCFGDPGIDALRAMTGRPVVGLAEAAMREAAAHGRFAIVTGGAAWLPILERIARGLGWAERLAAIEVLAANGAELAADPDAAVRSLGEACRRAGAGVDAVILGGAGLAGLAARIAPGLDRPLVDSVAAGSRALLAAARAGAAAPSRAGAETNADSGVPSRPEWTGLSPALRDRLG